MTTLAPGAGIHAIAEATGETPAETISHTLFELDRYGESVVAQVRVLDRRGKYERLLHVHINPQGGYRPVTNEDRQREVEAGRDKFGRDLPGYRYLPNHGDQWMDTAPQAHCFIGAVGLTNDTPERKAAAKAAFLALPLVAAGTTVTVFGTTYRFVASDDPMAGDTPLKVELEVAS